MGEVIEIDNKYYGYVKECSKKAMDELDLPIDLIFDNKSNLKKYNDLFMTYIHENEDIVKEIGSDISKVWEQYYIELVDESEKLSTNEIVLIKNELYSKVITKIHSEMNKVSFVNENGYKVHPHSTDKACSEIVKLDKIIWAIYDKEFVDENNLNYISFMIQIPLMQKDCEVIEESNNDYMYAEQDMLDNIPF